jgi:hypothetical protein
MRVHPEETPMTRRLALTVLLVPLLLTGCGGAGGGQSLSPGTPPEAAAACGHPGAVVHLKKVPVVIRHTGCDLTGVILRYGDVGATVPTSGGVTAEGDGLRGGSTLTLTVDPKTKDVAVHT